MPVGILTYDQIVELQQEIASGYRPAVPLREWMGREPTQGEAAILERAEAKCRSVPVTSEAPGHNG
jgi:hypothetical protein